jgi:CheY-like chemotaxis protein
LKNGKERILVVDDEVITLRITRKLLETNGYDVEISESSTDAMEKLSKEKFDLVIIDISMPALSGFDLLELMQSFDYKVPVIFLSANDNEWTIKEALNMGATRFVSKEKEFNFLPDIIRETLTSV